jgi:hypothetical protein
MIPRHAATLAMLGWYLMSVPVNRSGQPMFGMQLADWITWGSYDTAEECNRERRSFTKEQLDVYTAAAAQDHRKLTRSELQLITSAVCIATNDPRLNKR